MLQRKYTVSDGVCQVYFQIKFIPVSLSVILNFSLKTLANNYKHNLVEALYFLHIFKIVHQDIKPHNIMYSLKLKKLVLIDFGISNVINENVGEKTMTNFIGTYEYSTEEMKKLFFS